MMSALLAEEKSWMLVVAASTTPRLSVEISNVDPVRCVRERRDNSRTLPPHAANVRKNCVSGEMAGEMLNPSAVERTTNAHTGVIAWAS